MGHFPPFRVDVALACVHILFFSRILLWMESASLLMFINKQALEHICLLWSPCFAIWPIPAFSKKKSNFLTMYFHGPLWAFQNCQFLFLIISVHLKIPCVIKMRACDQPVSEWGKSLLCTIPMYTQNLQQKYDLYTFKFLFLV